MLVLNNGSIILDKMYLKNVVLVNVYVVYKGGPIELENVNFLNCTFQIISDVKGRQLAEQILANPIAKVSLS